eukprot:gene2391-5338_t
MSSQKIWAVLQRFQKEWRIVSGYNKLTACRQQLDTAHKSLTRATRRLDKSRDDIARLLRKRHKEVTEHEDPTTAQSDQIRKAIQNVEKVRLLAEQEQKVRLQEFQDAVLALQTAETIYAKANSMQKSIATFLGFAVTLGTPVFVLWRTGLTRTENNQTLQTSNRESSSLSAHNRQKEVATLAEDGDMVDIQLLQQLSTRITQAREQIVQLNVQSQQQQNILNTVQTAAVVAGACVFVTAACIRLIST